jgi:hypothetical protein
MGLALHGIGRLFWGRVNLVARHNVGASLPDVAENSTAGLIIVRAEVEGCIGFHGNAMSRFSKKDWQV